MKNHIETIILGIVFFVLLAINITTSDNDIEKVTLLGMSIVFMGVFFINISYKIIIMYIDKELDKIRNE